MVGFGKVRIQFQRAARFRVRTAPIPFTKQVHKCHGVVPLSEGVVQFNRLAAGGFRFIHDLADGSAAGLGAEQ